MATYPWIQDHMHRPADLLRRTVLFAFGMMAGAAIAAGVAVAVDGDGSTGASTFDNSSATITPVAVAVDPVTYGFIDPSVPGAIQPGIAVDFGGAGVAVDPVTHGFFDPQAAGATQPSFAATTVLAGAGTIDGPGPLAFGALPDLLAALSESAAAHTGVGAISPEELTRVLAGETVGSAETAGPAHSGIAAISAEALYRVLAGDTAAPAHAGVGAISDHELAQLLAGMP